MIYPEQKLKIDAIANKDLNDIARQYRKTEIDIAGMEELFNEAFKDMQDTDLSELRFLFMDGIKAGYFIAKNEHLIPKL